MKKIWVTTLFLFIFSLCVNASEAPLRIQLWHSMMYSHREVLAELVKEFEQLHPEVRVQLMYRETEELRSSFQAAALGGSGPEIVYGPADQVGPFATMNLLQPLDGVLTPEELADLDPLAKVNYAGSLFALGDSVGNHLMLIYNRKLVATPPTTVAEMEKMALAQTVDENHDGRMDRYGLVFNFTEPFFFVPWISAFGEGFFVDNHPHLNTKATVGAFSLLQRWRDELKIIPHECDYEMANALFKEGRAAMIINGDWSWGDYTKAKVDFGVAPMPMVDSTQQWPAPIVGTKGYSLNRRIQDPARLKASQQVLRFLLSPSSQLKFVAKVGVLPSSIAARQDASVTSSPLLASSAEIMKHGQPMPVVPEIRAVWDGLRGPYQKLLAGALKPAAAAEEAQRLAEKQIVEMNNVAEPSWQQFAVYVFGLAAAFALVSYCQRQWRKGRGGDRRERRFAYMLVLPAFLGIVSVILFPFLYTSAISVSNLSLRTFDDWHIVGFENYLEVILSRDFYIVFAKTVVWTLVNLIFHVGVGVLLAVIIEQTLPAKGIWRTLLIVPWAVPQYITALTWRAMFHQEYGSINIFLAHFFSLSPVQWLTQPFTAFAACTITNIWLGFPFMMVVALGGLQAIPHDLYEAARLDGANAWRRFWHVTWPMLLPVMKPAMVLGSIWTFNNFNVVWLVSNGGEPADQTHILVSYVYKSAFNLYRYGSAAAQSMVIFALLLVFTLWTSRKPKKKVTL